MRTNNTKDIMLEIVAVCFLATAGIFVRRSTFDPINTALWRMIFAVPFLFLLAFKNIKSIKKKDIFLAVLSGIFLSGDLIFFNLSLVNTSIANTNLFTNLTAFIIVPVSYFVFKEKIPKFYLVGLVITIIGVLVVMGGKSDTSGANIKGDIFAMCALVFYSLFFLTTYRLRDRVSSSVIMFIGAFGTIFALVFACMFISGGVRVPNSSYELTNLIGFAIFMQVVGQNLLAHCQGKISVNLSSAITLMQPVVAAIYSMLIFKEYLSVVEIIGICIVLTGVYICKRQYQNNK